MRYFRCTYSSSFTLAVWVSININIIAQPEGKAQCVKNRFADLTILRFCLQAKFAPFTRLEWMERIFSEYFPL